MKKPELYFLRVLIDTSRKPKMVHVLPTVLSMGKVTL
jgi:hypothetical protein